MTAWMDKYYGPEWKKTLQPRIVYERTNKAVVRVISNGSAGFVLVQKNGAHGVTPHEVLYVGVPNAAAYNSMQQRLAAADP